MIIFTWAGSSQVVWLLVVALKAGRCVPGPFPVSSVITPHSETEPQSICESRLAAGRPKGDVVRRRRQAIVAAGGGRVGQRAPRRPRARRFRARGGGYTSGRRGIVDEESRISSSRTWEDRLAAGTPARRDGAPRTAERLVGAAERARRR